MVDFSHPAQIQPLTSAGAPFWGWGSGLVDPGLGGRFRIVRVSAGQQHAAIAQLRFGHEMPRIAHLPCSYQESPACRIEDLHFLASARDEQLAGKHRHGFVRQLEAAVVQCGHRAELTRSWIVRFGAVEIPRPPALIGAARNQHSAVPQKPGRVFAARCLHAASLHEATGLRIVKFCTGLHTIGEASSDEHAPVLE